MTETGHGDRILTPIQLPDDEALLEVVTPNALAAGHDYADRGRVHDIAVSEDGTRIQALTQGTKPGPYRQTITLAPRRKGGLQILGTCTCPVAINCKHVAAALIAARTDCQDAPPGQPGPGGALPDGIANWLDALTHSLDAASEAYPESVHQRLFYVLAPASHDPSLLRIDAYAVTLRKDGSHGPARQVQPDAVNYAAAYLRPSDRTILRRLPSLARGAHPGGDDTDAVELLRRIITTGRGRWAELDGPALAEGPGRPGRIAWKLRPDGMQRAGLELDSGLLGLRLPAPWYVDPATGIMGPVTTDLPAATAATLLAAPPVPPEAAGRLAAELAQRLPAAPQPTALPEPEVIQGPAAPRLRLLRGRLPFDPARHRGLARHAPPGGAIAPLARLSFGYGPLVVPFARRAQPAGLVQDGRLHHILRDLRGEQSALARLGGIGFARIGEAPPMPLGHPHVDDFLLEDDQDGTDWLSVMLEEIPALEADGWVVETDDDFPFRLAQPDGPIAAELAETTGVDWLELHLGVMVDGEHVDLVPLLLRMLGDGSMAAFLDDDDEAPPFLIPLPNGRLLSLPQAHIRPTLQALLELFDGGGIEPDAQRIRFGRLDAATLAGLESVSGMEWQGGEALRTLGRQLREAGGAIPPATIPPSFRGTLRPYQAQGVAWLQFLARAGLGGVLADDMGLGKTVQALAHLAIEQAEGRLDRPALIVCPTSLIPNWTMEAARFAPSLKLLALHGPARKERFHEIAEHDLVLTTYPLLPRDHEALTAQDWHAVILDEAQTIKNPNAETTRQALRLQAGQRLCLSGTPLQNHLGELWSLFDFLAPGFLGDAKSFRSRYRTPIEKHGDVDRQMLLSRRVRPFLLRRTKDDVATELPPKTEIAEPVELGPAQRAIYEGIRLAMHARVQAAIAERGLARSGIVVLDALLKMRQACCDPRLLKLKAAQHPKVGSAKLDRLMELLAVLLGEGRRVLLFSQFTSMLALIQQRLNAAGIAHELLTGDTKDRATPVARFQAGEVPVFLISLKAGGVGLNLTAADTVIHYDPWWNPAVEDQATDRAHRIGQDKRVFVHRLITLGSIEEKMEALKLRKRALVASVLSAEGGGALKLTETDIEDLFAPA